MIPHWKTDYRAYMKAKNAERRAKAKAAGICIECNSDSARTGQTKCEQCARINRKKP